MCWIYSGFADMVYVHMCVGVCACVSRGWRQMSSFFLTLYSFRQSLLISGRGNCSAPVVLLFLSVQRMHTALPIFLDLGAEDLNSDPHTEHTPASDCRFFCE